MYQRNYSHCPLKKRPIKWDFQIEETQEIEEEPENLSTKPEDLKINLNSNYNSKILCPLNFNTQENPWTSYPVIRIPEIPPHNALTPILSPNNRYGCPKCSKSYSTNSGLSKHIQFHCNGNNQSKSFICKYCEKVYLSLGALKMHIRTHTLPCKCNLCGKAFSRPWLLQGHIRTHTGEKPFTCHHCDRAFADRSNLRAHLQTHSELKKYGCGKCGKSFSRASLLSKHEESC